MEKLKMKSKDLSQQHIAEIRKLFPNVVTEVKGNDDVKLKIDFDVLKQELSSTLIDDRQERYQMTWPGKKESILLSNTPTSMSLRPNIESSSYFFNSKNLYIEGDNLDALKILRETYLGKVKVIYIDPPYNTGNDFVYKDDFSIKSTNYANNSGQKDEQSNRLNINTETNGRFHSDWLSMMFSRLRLAKDFLTDDGAIFISIGDDEEANLIKICDEIFGEQNFIASICHKSRASVSNDRIISENHNHILFYAKNETTLFSKHREIGEDPDLSGFNQKDEIGEYKLVPVDGPGGAKKGNPYYEFLGVKGYWRYSEETMKEKYDKGLIVRTENGLQQKYYKETAAKSRKTVTTWWDDGFLTSTATSDLVKLMGAKTFDNPKNVSLVLRILKMMTKFDKEAIILDFFSGSGTTAEAVMRMNAEDNGNRKFILVQIPELCDEKSDAFHAGFKNICDIAKCRIKKVGEQLAKSSKVDVGFRDLVIDTSNMKDIYYSANRINQSILDDFISNIKDDRKPIDLIFQIMSELGILLSAKIEDKTILGKKVYLINGNDLIACFDKGIDGNFVQELAKLKPLYVCFKNASFEDDSSSVNCEQIFKTLSPVTKIKVI
jgi:adenine-specific DNA-methyltransferase